MYTIKEDIIPEIEALQYLFTKDVNGQLDRDINELHSAVSHATYCFTAWDEDRLIGMIRSSGDGTYLQLITDFVVHENYQSMGVASKLINAYLERASDVREFLMVTTHTFQSNYTLTWLEHKGFFLKSKDDFYIFHKKQ